MAIQLSEKGIVGSRKKALVLGLAAVMVSAGLLTGAEKPAQASAFPGKNGNIVFESNRDGNDEIYSMNPDGTGQTRLTNHPANDFDPAVSPDGTRIAFQSTRSGTTDVYVMDADGTDPVRITTSDIREGDPTWSADGEKIAFVREVVKDDDDIAVVNADGSGLIPIATGSENESEPTFSPDGEKIAFRSDQNGEDQIFTMDADGSNQERLTKGSNSEFHPTWSPDGKKVVFSSRVVGPNPAQIARINADGSGQKLLTNDSLSDFQPAYSPDGKKIAFGQREGTTSNIFTMNADGSGQEQLTDAGSTNNGAEWGSPVDFTVDSTSDQPDLTPDDGKCIADAFGTDVCTLRAAIQQANAIPGASTIDFDIPGTGVHTIRPSSDLPEIKGQVTIDGYTQPGASPNTLATGTNARIMVALDGSNAGNTSGLVIAAPKTVVKGLAIHSFPNSGVALLAPATGSTIEGNFIGTDAGGQSDLGNEQGGIFVINSSNTVGGSSPAARNLISGNGDEGINFTQTESGNRVLGNLIGTGKDGESPLGNDDSGVVTGFSDASVGDGTAEGANTIAFNGREGVGIFNFGNGPGFATTVSRNSIFSNGGPGIDLFADSDGDDGRTANDPGDADTGSNGLQNFPVLSSAKAGKKGTTVAGKLDSTPGKTFKVQLFSNPQGADEGQTLLGEKTVATGSSGDAAFTFKTKKKVGKGQNITATATDPDGNTSEFSAPKEVTKK